MNMRVITIKDIIKRLKKCWIYIIIFISTITMLSAYLAIRIIVPEYQSDAKILISGQLSDEKTNYNYNDISMYQSLLATYSEIIQSRDLIEDVISDTRVKISADEILSNLTVDAKERTQIITLSYISENKNEAKTILDSIIKNLTEKSEDIIPDGSINVITTSIVPETPLPSGINKIVLMAFLVTFVISIATVILIELLNNKISNINDIESIEGLIVIGELPEYTEKTMKKEIKVRGGKNKCYTVKKHLKADMQKI